MPSHIYAASWNIPAISWHLLVLQPHRNSISASSSKYPENHRHIRFTVTYCRLKEFHYAAKNFSSQNSCHNSNILKINGLIRLYYTFPFSSSSDFSEPFVWTPTFVGALLPTSSSGRWDRQQIPLKCVHLSTFPSILILQQWTGGEFN